MTDANGNRMRTWPLVERVEAQPAEVFPKLGAMGPLSYEGRSSAVGAFEPPAKDQLKLFGSGPGQRASRAA